MASRSDRTAGVEAEEVERPFLPWLGRACRLAREERGVVQVKIAAAIEVNQATIARFEDGSAWPRKPEEVLLAYATELDIDMRLLWVQALVMWFENEPVLDADSQEQIRGALKRLRDLGRGGALGARACRNRAIQLRNLLNSRLGVAASASSARRRANPLAQAGCRRSPMTFGPHHGLCEGEHRSMSHLAECLRQVAKFSRSPRASLSR